MQRYGEIAVDQDWGFGVTPTTRVANTNSNQWKDFTEVPGSVTATEKKWLRNGLNISESTIHWGGLDRLFCSTCKWLTL